MTRSEKKEWAFATALAMLFVVAPMAMFAWDGTKSRMASPDIWIFVALLAVAAVVAPVLGISLRKR